MVIERVDHQNVMNPILREKGIISLLGVPLLVRGQVLGVLHVGSLTYRRFTEPDVQLLQMVAERVALGLSVRLYEHERRLTEALQQTFLPVTMPRVPGLRFTSKYQPAAGIGGDWYDVLALGSGAVALAMGDVAGHGVEAAAAMGRLRNALRACAVEEADPADVVARLDRLMEALDVAGMVTLLFGVVDPNFSEFRFVSAGHVPPLVLKSGDPFFADDGRAIRRWELVDAIDFGPTWCRWIVPRLSSCIPTALSSAATNRCPRASHVYETSPTLLEQRRARLPPSTR